MSIRQTNSLDLALHPLLNLVLEQLAEAPSSPALAYAYYDTTLNKPRVWTGSAWLDLGGSGGGTAGDADTLDGQDGLYYLARGNHTGTQPASTISDLIAVVTALKLSQFAAPDAAVSFGGQRLTNLADPTGQQDAATQAYVLTQIAALVNAAPGALDTLNELAAALGNDANFATTVTNAITAAKDRANHTGSQLAATISDFATAVNALIAARGFAANVGDGSATTYVVTHNLNTRDVSVQLRGNAAPYAFYGADFEATDPNFVTIKFGVAPTAAQYRALIARVA